MTQEAAVAATIFARVRRLLGLQGPDAGPASPGASVRKAPTHHAVSIATGPRCCAAARELRGQRFLSREAPVLPLPACDRGDCVCRYEHHVDRRKNLRRARDMGVAVDGWVETDQRTKPHRGRRKADQRA